MSISVSSMGVKSADINAGLNTVKSPISGMQEDSESKIIENTQTQNTRSFSLFKKVGEFFHHVKDFLSRLFFSPEKVNESTENNIDKRQLDAYFIEAADNADTHVMLELLKQGANIDAPDALGETALVKAASLGHHELVDFLIEAGAHIEATGFLGNTVLLNAVEHGHAGIVEKLIKAGANIEAVDADKETLTALHITVMVTSCNYC